ncbi:unnamed protein product, partial [marine sediment metagenome]
LRTIMAKQYLILGKIIRDMSKSFRLKPDSILKMDTVYAYSLS